MIRIRAETNELETQRTMSIITQSWLFQKISKTDEPIDKLARRNGRPELLKLETKRELS